jgi:hypothetical protein
VPRPCAWQGQRHRAGPSRQQGGQRAQRHGQQCERRAEDRLAEQAAHVATQETGGCEVAAAPVLDHCGGGTDHRQRGEQPRGEAAERGAQRRRQRGQRTSQRRHAGQ